MEDDAQVRKPTRRELRKRRKDDQVKNLLNMDMRRVTPLTNNQAIAFHSYSSGQNLVLHGIAGTGKTFLSLYLAINDVLSRDTPTRRVVLVRSVVPTRDVGFLPGSVRDKIRQYELPYIDACSRLFGRGDAYDVLCRHNVVEFTSTSFVRGMTFDDAVIVVDEIQNMTFHELDSIITRVGDNCRVILSGDFRQSDLTREADRRGVLDFLKVVGSIGSFDQVEFDVDDIVRSKLVRDYIVAKDALGIVT
jgi:phosphate starvation-inducible protein PhoH